MTRSPVDAAARRHITDATTSTLFVNAGAGSGKTKTLVDRIEQLVLRDGLPLAAIAAVTFTERAGAELRDRLRAQFEATHRAATDTDQRQRAAGALDDLDSAAIGTLHSFAQRILAEHPIEAGLPPEVEVLDEVGSSVAFLERWSEFQSALLDDDSIARPLIVCLTLGVKLSDLRGLAQKLGRDWDLIESRVIGPELPRLRFRMPDPAALLSRMRVFLDVRQHCRNPADKLLACVDGLRPLIESVESAPDDESRLLALRQLGAHSFRHGKATDWGGRKDEVTAAGRALCDEAAALVEDTQNLALRIVTQWIGGRVSAEAQLRRREGWLEFHDLLVLARTMLRHHADVRAAVSARYRALLLDEFQDTDPIQIEIAARICGGRAAAAADWRDIDIPPGSLFVVGDPKQSIYRFRRASISTYLSAEQQFDDRPSLTTNFRTVAPILQWVNGVFASLITPASDAQPEFVPLAPFRDEVGTGPAVTLLGAEAHPDEPRADELRHREAADVAGLVRRVMTDRWTVWDERSRQWRPARHEDIAVLVPARTSLPMLEDALERSHVPYVAESSSLVYQASEVRDLLMCARAVADASDALALVAVLRSPLFGCGDDDLWQWRWNAGATQRPFSLYADTDGVSGPVADALRSLRALHHGARWSTPSELLGRIAADRRMFEVAATGPRARDSWRRLRFVIDQARAWSEVSHGGLRAYLAWAAHQGQEVSRVAEAVLPETDVDAVRIMTVHAAKGLEFPIVILSGMTSRPVNASGVVLLWPPAGGFALRVRKGVETEDFQEALPVDEQMDDLERRRLLYVATTRARDHLVVSVHRSAKDNGGRSSAGVLAAAPAVRTGAETFTAEPGTAPEPLPTAMTVTVPDQQLVEETLTAARVAAQQVSAISASGLEGTEPAVELEAAAEPGAAKGPRGLDLPPWSKGRYGSGIGRAVHGVLQSVDLATGSGLDDAVRSQSIAEGVVGNQDLVRALVGSALASEEVRAAATLEHWREMYVGTTQDDGTILEGFMDLVVRDPDGMLTVIDYKTDAVPAGGIGSRVEYYRPQMDAYRRALHRATGAVVTTKLLFLHPERPAVGVEVR